MKNSNEQEGEEEFELGSKARSCILEVKFCFFVSIICKHQ